MYLKCVGWFLPGVDVVLVPRGRGVERDLRVVRGGASGEDVCGLLERGVGVLRGAGSG